MLGTHIWLAWLVVVLLPHQQDLYTFHVLFLYGMKQSILHRMVKRYSKEILLHWTR
jgi:hypothetical protein